MTTYLFERNLRRAKQDISEFKSENPYFEINTFEDLHDYFDANVYVQCFSTDTGIDYEKANKTIEVLNNYIKQAV